MTSTQEIFIQMVGGAYLLIALYLILKIFQDEKNK